MSSDDAASSGAVPLETDLQGGGLGHVLKREPELLKPSNPLSIPGIHKKPRSIWTFFGKSSLSSPPPGSSYKSGSSTLASSDTVIGISPGSSLDEKTVSLPSSSPSSAPYFQSFLFNSSSLSSSQTSTLTQTLQQHRNSSNNVAFFSSSTPSSCSSVSPPNSLARATMPSLSSSAPSEKGWICPHCSLSNDGVTKTCGIYGRQKFYKAKSQSRERRSPKSSTWRCQACFYDSQNQETRCEMCHNPRDEITEHVKGALSVPELINQLVSGELGVDAEFRWACFLSLPSFTDPCTVFRELLHHISLPPHDKNFYQSTKVGISAKLAQFSVLQYWHSVYPCDFSVGMLAEMKELLSCFPPVSWSEQQQNWTFRIINALMDQDDAFSPSEPADKKDLDLLRKIARSILCQLEPSQSVVQAESTVVVTLPPNSGFFSRTIPRTKSSSPKGKLASEPFKIRASLSEFESYPHIPGRAKTMKSPRSRTQPPSPDFGTSALFTESTGNDFHVLIPTKEEGSEKVENSEDESSLNRSWSNFTDVALAPGSICELQDRVYQDGDGEKFSFKEKKQANILLSPPLRVFGSPCASSSHSSPLATSEAVVLPSSVPPHLDLSAALVSEGSVPESNMLNPSSVPSAGSKDELDIASENQDPLNVTNNIHELKRSKAKLGTDSTSRFNGFKKFWRWIHVGEVEKKLSSTKTTEENRPRTLDQTRGLSRSVVNLSSLDDEEFERWSTFSRSAGFGVSGASMSTPCTREGPRRSSAVHIRSSKVNRFKPLRQSISSFATDLTDSSNAHLLNYYYIFEYYSPYEVAVQMTLLTMVRLRKCHPRDFLGRVKWDGQEERNQIKISNTQSLWVAFSILDSSTHRERCRRFRSWLLIAEKCFELNNFNSVFEIVCGLNHHSVYRLKMIKELSNHKKVSTKPLLLCLLSFVPKVCVHPT